VTAKILFLCPHSAGKSLAAATYFQAAAARVGLDVSIEVAGPEPDEVNMPGVEAELTKQGYTIGWQPRLVTSKDADSAELIISIGCDLSSLPTNTDITEWNVPLISEDLLGSLQAIQDHANSLANELTAKWK